MTGEQVCKTCFAPLNVKNWQQSYQKRGYLSCKACNVARTIKWREANYEHWHSYAYEYRHKPENLAKARKAKQLWCLHNRDNHNAHARERNRNYRYQMRLAIITKLGGKCARCRLVDARILQLDHKNGGGITEKRRLGFFAMNRKVLVMPLDECRVRYQLLCPNCNWIKRRERNEFRILRLPSESQKDRKKDMALRQRLMSSLGRKCAKCGFSDIRALQVDHIHGRSRPRMPPKQFYRYVVKLPTEIRLANYQLLCANCNWVKYYECKEYLNRAKAETTKAVPSITVAQSTVVAAS